MVTHEQIRDHLGRKPFVPFRVILNTGENVDILRSFQAATMNRRMIVGTGENGFRWIWHDQIDRVEVAEFRPA